LAAKIGEGKVSGTTRRTSCSKEDRRKREVEVDELWGVEQHTAFCGKKAN
jgi:hypothetical protein